MNLEKILLHKRFLFIFLSCHILFWGALSTIVDLHPDMVDHWIWSQHISLSYYEHPPMVALMMRLFTSFLPVLAGLRVGAAFFSGLIMALCYGLGCQFFNRRTAAIFVLIMATTPYFTVGQFFWHIDQAYMVFWLLGLMTLGRWLDSKNDRLILLFGLILGLGSLSKYTIGLLYVVVLIWIGVTPKLRILFRKWQTYAAPILSAFLFLPVVIWNVDNNWASFQYQMSRGLSGGEGQFFSFTGGHLLLFSLIFSSWSLLSLFRTNLVVNLGTVHRADEKGRLLVIAACVPMGLFSCTSFWGKISDPHWCNVSYFSLFLLLSASLDQSFRQRKWLSPMLKIACVMNLVVVTLLIAQIRTGFLNIPREIDRSIELYGWEQTAREIDELVRSYDRNLSIDYVVSREYQLASALSLHLKNRPFPHSVEKPERNMWSPHSEVGRGHAILVCPKRECGNTRVMKYIGGSLGAPFKPIGQIQVSRQGKVVRELQVLLKKPALPEKVSSSRPVDEDRSAVSKR